MLQREILFNTNNFLKVIPDPFVRMADGYATFKKLFFQVKYPF